MCTISFAACSHSLRRRCLASPRADDVCHGDKLVKSATACAHRLNQRLSRMRKLGMDATTEPALAEAPIKSEPAPAEAPEPAPAETPEPAPAEAPTEPCRSEPAPAPAKAPEPAPAEAPEPAPAMSSAPVRRAIQSLWQTLATEQTPGNIEMYRLFRRLGSTISSATYMLRISGSSGRNCESFASSWSLITNNFSALAFSASR